MSAGEWASRAVGSALVGKGGGEDVAVPWDALWKSHDTPTHRIVRGFTLKDLMRSHGCLIAGPSSLARPGEDYKNLVKMFEEPKEKDGEKPMSSPSTTGTARRRR